MAEPRRTFDPRGLTPTQLVRLLNSTPRGAVTNAAKLHRQLDEAGLRVTSPDGKRVDLLKFTAWLARRRDQRVEERRAPVDAYAARLQRDLERKLAASRVGRDIAPIPALSPDGVARRARCGDSFEGFCTTYFPSAFCLPFSDDHMRIIATIERSVREGGLFAFAMPRGSGKTSLSRVAAMWALLYGYRDYVCLIGSAEDQAKMMLDAVRREMLGNDLLLEDFPEAIYPIRKLENNARKQAGQLCDGRPTYITWAADRLVMPTIEGSPSSGGVITVAGLDSNIRGQHHTKMDGTVVRPSLVILDDPQTRQSAASPTQTKHRLSILNGDVLGLAGPNVKIAGFMTCTKIYHGDLADQILDRAQNPEWQGACTKMVYAFPPAGGPAEKLWDRYAQLRAEGLREGDGGARATAFYAEHRAVMDAGAVVAWPQRHHADELSALQHAMNLKLRDEAAFFAEYQNEPLAEQAEQARQEQLAEQRQKEQAEREKEILRLRRQALADQREAARRDIGTLQERLELVRQTAREQVAGLSQFNEGDRFLTGVRDVTLNRDRQRADGGNAQARQIEKQIEAAQKQIERLAAIEQALLNGNARVRLDGFAPANL